MKEKVVLSLCMMIFTAEITYCQNMRNYEKKRLQPWNENSRYWQYEGKPVMLFGASDDDNLFQWPGDLLVPHLDTMKKIGANYVRNTMSDRKDKGFEIYPFKQLENGKYDLNQWNEAYWKRFDFFLKETARRKIIVQIELWDRFDFSQKNWKSNPYNPKNNINYDKKKSGLSEEYPDHPGLNRHPFFFTTPQQQNNQTLLSIQKKYMEKILSHSLKYNHILYCIDNETSGEEEWATYWRDFITGKAAEKGKKVSVTEMWDDWNLQSPRHKRTFDHPERYQFGEISQNTHQNGEKLWNSVRWVYNYMEETPRPLNVVKTYGSDEGRFGTAKEGIERWWLHLLGGAASIRFHRPDAGLGLSELSISSLKAARKLESLVKLWDLKADRQSLLDRSKNEAYIAYKSDEVYVIFLPDGGSTALHLNESKAKYAVMYINIRTGEWLDKKPQKMAMAGTTEFSAPDNNEWLIVVTKTRLLPCNHKSDIDQTLDVIIDTDLGGDPDDIQSLYRAVHYSDIIKVKGIISTPMHQHPWDTIQNTELINNWIKRIDVERLRQNGYEELMREEDLLSIIKAGADKPGGPAANKSTEGSEWIIQTARKYSNKNPIWILVWASMTTTAQALYDAPDIADKIRIYYIGSSNTLHDIASRDFVYNFMVNEYPELWWIENGILPKGSRETFRGIYQSGIQDGEWSFTKFIDFNIRNHGSNHNGLFQEKCGDIFPLANSPRNSLKEGDSPSLLFLISPVIGEVGSVDDPTQESWGGQFMHFDSINYPNYYIDLDKYPAECQMTIGKWRYDILSDWKMRWDRYEKE